MTSQLRSGIVEKKLEVNLSSEVECDELYLLALKPSPSRSKKVALMSLETVESQASAFASVSGRFNGG